MKTHRVLGILWMMVCAIAAIRWLLMLTVLVPSLRQHTGLLGVCFYLFFFLLYLAGVVASYQMFQGANWARVFVGFIAALGFISCVAQFVAYKTVWLWGGVSCVFYLVSLLILFAPRYERVA